MIFDKKINIIEPKKFQNVGDNFLISGMVPRAWLQSDYGFRNNISLELYDITGKCIMGSGINLNVTIEEIESAKNNAYFKFSSIFQFSHFGHGFIEKSQGCMNVRLGGWKKKTQSVFIPINVIFFEPKNGVDSEIIRRHANLGSLVRKYERDSVVYMHQLDRIYKSRQKKCTLEMKRILIVSM